LNLVSVRIWKKNYGKRIIATYLLAYLLTLFVYKLRINVKHGRVVTTLNKKIKCPI
jgi:hypothetical protein